MSTEERDAAPVRFLRGGLLLVLLLSPLPFGSVQPWAVLSVELVAALLGALALFVWFRDPGQLPARGRILFGLGSLVVGLGAWQLVPLPPSWVRAFAAPTALAREQVAPWLPTASSGWAPLTLSPADTVDALLRLIACVLLGLVAALTLQRERDLHRVAVLLALSGAFQALYGAAEYLSGHQHIFAYAKKYYFDEASGTFVNRNHFAGYLALTLPFALALALEAARRLRPAAGWRQRLLRGLEPQGLLLLFGLISAALIWTGCVLSYSRTGLAAALAGAAFLLWQQRRWRGPAWLLAGALALPTLLLLGSEVRAPGERFFGENLLPAGGRLAVWSATLKMLPSYAWFGSGLGTFEEVFALYRPPSIHKLWDHAHNDWLQALAEGGVLTLAALVAVLVVLLRSPGSREIAAATRRFPVATSALHGAVSAAIVAIALHSVADFCVRIPAIGILTAVLVGTRGAIGAHRRLLAD